METNGDTSVEVVPVRHVSRWVGWALLALFVAMLVHTIFSKIPLSCTLAKGTWHCSAQHWRFGWNQVFHYFTNGQVLKGLVVTLELTVLAMIVGIFLGIVVAIMRLSHSRLLSGAAWSYTWAFRGTPVYVQLLFWGFIGDLYPYLSIGIPFTHIYLVHFHAISVFIPFNAAVAALGLNEGAYFSEIVRSGLIAVDEGQTEAATSLGMTRSQTLRNVVLPQAMRVIIPPTGNEVISMLKTTSLVVAIAVVDLLGAVTNIYNQTFQIMPMLILASLWYLIVSTILSIGQFYLERFFARGALRTPPPTPIQRIRHDLRGIASKYRTKRGVQVGTTS
ncbi:MAG TPA: amino acid ABC transporter permease [Acidimicrobiales bacterium]